MSAVVGAVWGTKTNSRNQVVESTSDMKNRLPTLVVFEPYHIADGRAGCLGRQLGHQSGPCKRPSMTAEQIALGSRFRLSERPQTVALLGGVMALDGPINPRSGRSPRSRSVRWAIARIT